jgi:hypothetical protein
MNEQHTSKRYPGPCHNNTPYHSNARPRQNKQWKEEMWMGNVIHKLTDMNIIAQLNEKLYPVTNKKRKQKRSLTDRPGYINRTTISRLHSNFLYNPLGHECFLFITSVLSRNVLKRVTIFIKNGAYYIIQNIENVGLNTVVFGYCNGFTFFAMDMVYHNSIKMKWTPTNGRSFVKRRKLVSEFLSHATSNKQTTFKLVLQTVFPMSDIKTMKCNTLFFYDNFKNRNRILKWADKIYINAVCKRNSFTEDYEFKIENKTHKSEYTVKTATQTQKIPENSICIFEMKEADLDYVGINPDTNVNIDDNFSYKSKTEFYVDNISYKELVQMYS